MNTILTWYCTCADALDINDITLLALCYQGSACSNHDFLSVVRTTASFYKPLSCKASRVSHEIVELVPSAFMYVVYSYSNNLLQVNAHAATIIMQICIKNRVTDQAQWQRFILSFIKLWYHRKINSTGRYFILLCNTTCRKQCVSCEIYHGCVELSTGPTPELHVSVSLNRILTKF